MPTKEVRAAARACRDAFDFLVAEHGYRRRPTRFYAGGFSVDYLGSTVGVEVVWHLRDELFVWLMRLVGGVVPDRPIWIHRDTPLNWFALEDVEVTAGHVRQFPATRLYSLPDAENAELLAANLRTYAADLLAGDLSRVPMLEALIRERVRRNAEIGWSVPRAEGDQRRLDPQA